MTGQNVALMQTKIIYFSLHIRFIVSARLLRAFSARTLHTFDERFLALAEHADEKVQHRALRALGNYGHQKVRELGLSRLSAGERDGNTIYLFRLTYQPEGCSSSPLPQRTSSVCSTCLLAASLSQASLRTALGGIGSGQPGCVLSSRFDQKASFGS